MASTWIRGLRPSWIAFGWFIAAAVTGVIVLALAALGGVQVTEADHGVWTGMSVAVGFLVGGFFVGWRTGSAPLAHAVAIGVFSVLVWLLVNLIATLTLPDERWEAVPLATAVLLLMLQIGATAIGAWAGVRWTHDPRPPISA